MYSIIWDSDLIQDETVSEQSQRLFFLINFSCSTQLNTKFKSLINNSIVLFTFFAKIYIVVHVKTQFWRVHTICVLDIKKGTENNVSPFTTYSFTIIKVGRKGVYITRT